MIDCHTHLDDERLICDIDQIVGDFDNDGIEFVIDASADYVTMQQAFALSQKYDRVFATIGCHPNDALTFDHKMADLMAEYAKNPKVVAVGEGGIIDGKEIKMVVKVGDTILYSKYAGSEYKIDGENYVIIRQSDVLAKVL